MKLDSGGLIPATALPMTADALVHEKGLGRYIRPVTKATPKALAINVDTGRGRTSGRRSAFACWKLWVDESGDHVPVVAGLGGQFTAQAVSLASFKAVPPDCVFLTEGRL